MLGVVCAWPMAPSSPTAPQTHPPNKSVCVHVCEWVEKAEEETSDGLGRVWKSGVQTAHDLLHSQPTTRGGHSHRRCSHSCDQGKKI